MFFYEIIEGARRGSHVYISGSYVYTKEKDNGKYRYLQCVEFREGCPGRASIYLKTDQFALTREHNDHQQVTDEKVEVLKLRTTLKRRAEISQGTLKQIFDEEASSSRVGGQVSFVNLGSSMYKRRKLNRPNIPQDAEDAISLLNDSSNEYKQYLTFTINEPENGEFALGFMSRSWSTTLQVNSESLLQAVATFYVVPNQFYQLLNIFLQFKSYTLPAVHILMSQKTSVLYSKIVENFKEIFQFTVSGIVQISRKHYFNHFLMVSLGPLQVVVYFTTKKQHIRPAY